MQSALKHTIPISVHGSGAVTESEKCEDPAPRPPEFLQIRQGDNHELELEIGTLVELHTIEHNVVYGVIKWLELASANSNKNQMTAMMAGIELEEELAGATNGWHEGTQFFACPDRKAVFVPLTHLMPDKRFENGFHQPR